MKLVTSILGQLLLFTCISGCGGRVVAIKLPRQDPNVNAYYLCQPSANEESFECASGRAFHQYDSELAAGAQCEYGVAALHVETDWRGRVTRIQYVCAVAAVSDLPPDPAPQPTAGGGH